MPGPYNSLNIKEAGFQSFDGVSVFHGRTLTAGTGVTITNGDGISANPTISLAGGGVAVEHLTGDSGGQLNPDGSNNFNLLGQQAGTIPVMDSIGSGSTIKFEDRTWISPFVVDASSTVGLRGTYTTIQSAVNAAATGQCIIIRPGTYTENITISTPGLTICAFTAEGLSYDGNHGVIVKGKLTLNTASDTTCISGINFTSNADYIIEDTGALGCFCYFKNCAFQSSTNTIIHFTDAGNGRLYFYNCTAFLGGVNVAWCVWSSVSSMLLNECHIYNSTSTTASTFASTAGGYWNIIGGEFGCAISMTSAAPLTIDNCYMDASRSGLTQITLANTSSLRASGCDFQNGSNSVISAGAGTSAVITNSTVNSSATNVFTGAGTVSASNISFTGSSSGVNTTTQTPLTSYIGARKVALPAGDYTVLNFDSFIGATTSGARAITLPATPSTGQQHTVKDITGTGNANNITVSGNGKNIDGAATYVMNTNYGSADFIYNGTNWFVI